MGTAWAGGRARAWRLPPTRRQSRPLLEPPDQTALLLRRHHDGDSAALHELLAHAQAWVRARVARRLGPQLRRQGETADFVQAAMVAALRHGPRFVVADAVHFKRLLARIVENVLRDQHDLQQAGKRGGAAAVQSVIDLDQAVAASQTSPSVAAQRDEMRQWMTLALELLDPTDRKVLIWREHDGLAFGEIGQRLGIGENGARMRFARAVPKLAERLRQLRSGGLRDALDDAGA